MLNVSRDTLNPALNLENLKARLEAIEYYKNRVGHRHMYWPHYVIGDMGRHLMKYKFNYAVKGILLYSLYREIKNYNHLFNVTFMNVEHQTRCYTKIIWAGILAGGVILYL